jgi:coenzyme F420-dependent glucose-6-phosphate dehydrogenase
MPEFGYKLSSEEHGPADLVRWARRAEECGFSFVSISDHYHPWTKRQGHAPFVWSVIGALSQATERIGVITGVTCPSVRIHPAVVAHAAATSAVMLPGRFSLGVGSGENLNEHILGDRWPETPVRLEMLEEAIEVMRKLWGGGMQSHHGRHYTMENAQLFDLPQQPPPIVVAGSGPSSVDLAGRLGDGFCGLAPTQELIDRFEEAGGAGKPRYTEVTVCYAADESEARRTAFEIWPLAGVKGQLMQELPLPSHFEQAAAMLHEEDALESIPCGPDAARHIDSIKQFLDAGYDHIWIHQIGPDQEGFFRFYADEVLPKI